MLKRILLIAIPFMLLTACASAPAQPSTEITVEMADFTYSPSSITVPAGEPVTITVENIGNVEHDFVVEKIDAITKVIQDSGSEAHHAHGEEKNYDVHVSAGVGEVSVFELTVSEPGTYKIFCSVEGHEQAGMIGELIALSQE